VATIFPGYSGEKGRVHDTRKQARSFFLCALPHSVTVLGVSINHGFMKKEVDWKGKGGKKEN
jgi:hypothetical protein